MNLRTRGLEATSGYYSDFYCVISGSFIYFYKNKKDLMPKAFFFLLDLKHSNEFGSGADIA